MGKRNDNTKGFTSDPWHPHLWMCHICGATVNEPQHTPYQPMLVLALHRAWHEKQEARRG